NFRSPGSGSAATTWKLGATEGARRRWGTVRIVCTPVVMASFASAECQCRERVGSSLRRPARLVVRNRTDRSIFSCYQEQRMERLVACRRRIGLRNSFAAMNQGLNTLSTPDAQGHARASGGPSTQGQDGG